LPVTERALAQVPAESPAQALGGSGVPPGAKVAAEDYNREGIVRAPPSIRSAPSAAVSWVIPEWALEFGLPGMDTPFFCESFPPKRTEWSGAPRGRGSWPAGSVSGGFVPSGKRSAKHQGARAASMCRVANVCVFLNHGCHSATGWPCTLHLTVSMRAQGRGHKYCQYNAGT
ncbi:MAG: hypothetical protein ACPIOQ_84285, partial [Promethearchaeia archaeon]